MIYSVSVFQAKNEAFRDICFSDRSTESLKKKVLAWNDSDGYDCIYSDKIHYSTDRDAESIAEELFDISNNPSRETEREKMFGRVRSLSVGDFVIVDYKMFVCAPVGWIEL